MCEIQEIRYVHHMEHPDYPHSLAVGCVCAENMEDDYVSPRLRERRLRNAAARKRKWLSRTWRESARGNDYLNTDGYNIVIFPRGSGWAARIRHRESDRSQDSRKTFPTADAAKLAAFDALIFLKDKARNSSQN